MASKRIGDPESFNRVFILGAKDLREDELKEEFDRYGLVKDVYFVKDRRTNERKDVAYVTYSKASEAALAIEEMNGKSLAEGARPLKVILANSRSEGSVRDANEDAKMMRLFIVVPDGFSENDVQEDFTKFGDVESVRFLKDRATGRNKSLAYVNFKRAYHAALALEGCDAHYKPVFATAPGNNKSSDERRRESDPRRRDDRSLSRDRDRRGSSYSLPPPPSSRSASSSSMSHDVLDMIRNYPSHGETILEAMIPGGLSYDQTCKLFDLVPGLEKFNYDPSSGIAHIKYSIPQLASYARDKFDGLEYPPGCHVLVQYYNKPTRRYEPPGSDYGSSINSSILAMRRGIQATEQDPNGPGAIKSLVDTIQKAMLLLQQTGLPPSATANMAWALKGLDRERYNESSYGGGGGGGGGLGDNGGDARYCSVPLPDRQPLASASSDVAQRLFIVSVPEAFPQSFLEDCFCRFGHLITAFFMPGRNCGYVKYASMDSARRAVNTLHMQTVCGNTLKVMVAEEPPPSSKRHYDDDGHSGSPAGKHSRVM